MSQEPEHDGGVAPGSTEVPHDSTRSEGRAIARTPELKREAILPAPDRSRVAAVAAMCSLAGIAVGFGLSMFALQMTEVGARNHCPRRAAMPMAQRAIPYLGITFISAHDSVGPHDDVGARVITVHRGTPADTSGLRVGDVIIGYDGDLVDDADEMVRNVHADRIGSRPVIDVIRGEETVQIVPTLDALRVWR
jgi:membrane-associated protease RseP (regulator of RpoE activity)